MTTSTKPLQDADTTQRSLLALREELHHDMVGGGSHVEIKHLLWKINSCLYSTYPSARNSERTNP